MSWIHLDLDCPFLDIEVKITLTEGQCSFIGTPELAGKQVAIRGVTLHFDEWAASKLFYPDGKYLSQNLHITEDQASEADLWAFCPSA